MYTVYNLFDGIASVFEYLTSTYSALPPELKVLILSTFGIFLFFGTARLFL